MEAEFTGYEESEPPSGKKQQPTNKCLQAVFRRKRLYFTEERQFCSEARNTTGRDQHGPGHWPALKRHSWLQGVLTPEGAGYGSASDMPEGLPGVSPVRAFSLGLGLIEAYLEGRCGQGLSPHRQGLEVGGLWQREGGNKWEDAQDLAGPAASGQQGARGPLCP